MAAAAARGPVVLEGLLGSLVPSVSAVLSLLIAGGAAAAEPCAVLPPPARHRPLVDVRTAAHPGRGRCAHDRVLQQAERQR